MMRGTVLVASALIFASSALALASLTPAQMAAADHEALLTVPTPAEFFGAIDKVSRPDWAAFYRDPGPTSFPSRPQAAFNLGVLVTDGYIAVEAQDGQQVKNTGVIRAAIYQVANKPEVIFGLLVTGFPEQQFKFCPASLDVSNGVSVHARLVTRLLQAM